MTDVTNNGAGQTGRGGQGGGTTTSDARAEALSSLQNAAQTTVADLTERAAAARDTAREWATAQADVARQTVVEKPFASAGAAFAAGLVFGLLLARR